MGKFYIMMELHWEGSATHKANMSVFRMFLWEVTLLHNVPFVLFAAY